MTISQVNQHLTHAENIGMRSAGFILENYLYLASNLVSILY